MEADMDSVHGDNGSRATLESHRPGDSGLPKPKRVKAKLDEDVSRYSIFDLSSVRLYVNFVRAELRSIKKRLMDRK